MPNYMRFAGSTHYQNVIREMNAQATPKPVHSDTTDWCAFPLDRGKLSATGVAFSDSGIPWNFVLRDMGIGRIVGDVTPEYPKVDNLYTHKCAVCHSDHIGIVKENGIAYFKCWSCGHSTVIDIENASQSTKRMTDMSRDTQNELDDAWREANDYNADVRASGGF